MPELSKKTCVPCKGGVPKFTEKEIAIYLPDISKWRVVERHHLEKEWRFPDFAKALHFVNQLGKIAEEQNHHPDIFLAWGLVRVQIWTHKIDGLTESDFILAAKFDTILG